MSLSVGIVGLPNVGKSTLFNALLRKQVALSANYPFATIDPNVGVVEVPDDRLSTLSSIVKESEKMSSLPPCVHATVKFVDIAGLVKGAADGAGLGNKFLSHIREVDMVAHVVRVFEDGDVIREGAVDPKSDYETIRAELLIADIEMCERAKVSRKKDRKVLEVLDKVITAFGSGKSLSDAGLGEEELEKISDLSFLSEKQEVVVLNVSEDSYSSDTIEGIVDEYAKRLGLDNSKFVVICAKIESELSTLTSDDQKEYLQDLGLQESGLSRLVLQSYKTLGLLSFLTAGEKEIRAWTVKSGTDAQNASGVIHTDFVKNFIKAEVVSYDDFVSLNGWKGAREKGKARMEGKDYIVQEGDVVEFKIGR